MNVPQTLIGVLDGTVQWLLGHAPSGDARALLTAVIGGPGTHTRLSSEALIELMVGDVKRLYPDWPTPLSTRLVREKHATIAATPDTEALRPKTISPVKGLWLAGDYTVPGYPGSLETAVYSGIVCARKILRAEQRRAG